MPRYNQVKALSPTKRPSLLINHRKLLYLETKVLFVWKMIVYKGDVSYMAEKFDGWFLVQLICIQLSKERKKTRQNTSRETIIWGGNGAFFASLDVICTTVSVSAVD